MNAIENLAEQIRKHPLLAIAGSASWSQTRFGVGDALELTVKLRNVGERPVTFDNPLGSTDPNWTGLRLVVAVAKADDKLDWANEVAHVDIARQDLLTTERRLPKAEPRIELAPGKGTAVSSCGASSICRQESTRPSSVSWRERPDNPHDIGGVLDMDLGRIEVVP